MKAKEKANELVEGFSSLAINFPFIDSQDGKCIGAGYMTHQSAKACALIAANEAFLSVDWASDFNDEKRKFWQQVKEEILKL